MDNVTVITIASIVVANIGTTILLFTWATNHAAQDNREMKKSSDSILEAIRTDVREYREKSHQLEVEFKERLLKIEERRAGIVRS
jgi:hypothetical protein